MQLGSGAPLAAAITAQERPIFCRVKCDWDRDGFGADGSIDDLTPYVSSITVSRALTTDLPEQARPFSGITAASATVELAKDEGPNAGQHAAWLFSPYNAASPLIAKNRKGAPAFVEVGFLTSAGLEYVRLLTGRVRRIGVSSGQRSATLELVDNSEALRKQVLLPMVVANDGTIAENSYKPGLTGAWVADYVLRQCGYYASPPPRANCVFSATYHGSGFPEIGVGTSFHGQQYSQLAFPPATAGFSTVPKFVASVETNGSTGQNTDYLLASTVSPNTGGRLFVEGWWRLADLTGGANGQSLWQVGKGGAASPYVSGWVDSGGRLQVDVHRGGADTNHSTGTSGPSGFVANTWYYVAVYVEFNSGNVNVWLNKDGTWTGPFTVTTTATQAAAAMDQMLVARGKAASFGFSNLNGWTEAVQATTENGAGTPPASNHAFVPTAIVMAGKNDLVATPGPSSVGAQPGINRLPGGGAAPTMGSEEAWSILQSLAAAELGMAGTLEDGTPFYRDRSFFTTAPQTVSQRTLSATDAITDLGSDESTDSVKNHIVIGASAPEVQGFADVWHLSKVVPVGGPDVTFWAVFDNPVANLDISVTYTTGTTSRYHASTAPDGNGTLVNNLTITVVPFAQAAKITIHNPNGFPVYLVTNVGEGVAVGAPNLYLWGQAVLFNTGTGQGTSTRQEASDATSIAAFGEQLWEESGNPWLQDLDSVGLKATDLLAMLKDGKPTLQGLAIVGDPRLQLGDRDTVVDAGGLVVSTDVHLAEIVTTVTSGDDGKLAQTISTRAT